MFLLDFFMLHGLVEQISKCFVRGSVWKCSLAVVKTRYRRQLRRERRRDRPQIQEEIVDVHVLTRFGGKL